jgi:hypothetical protein
MELSPPEDSATSTLSGVDGNWLDNHLTRIRKLIADEAIRIAKDIAKLFAGAVVGSTGAAAAFGTRRELSSDDKL